MRFISQIVLILISISCGHTTVQRDSDGERNKSDQETLTPAREPADTSNWVNSFSEFSRAVIAGNKNSVKQFIDFPIMNAGNEIWFLANPALVMEIDQKKVKPFTASDFERYFSSIFTSDLREALKKISVGQLIKLNSSASPEIEVVKGSKSKLEVTYDKSERRIDLLLIIKGNEFEYGVNYELEITTENVIRFRQVRVAG